MDDAQLLTAALVASRRKILVFLFSVLTLIVVFASFLYVIEGPERGFTSIPISIYWAIVTLTTVGYGDIVPQTGMGRVVAGCAMIAGYSIIAVPTGIVTVELANAVRERGEARRVEHQARVRGCVRCGAGRQRRDARFCWNCGARLAPVDHPNGEAG
jgi:voltage-gated potassium channel